MPVFMAQQMQQQRRLLPGHWSTIRTPIAIITDIITMVTADTITVQITTATGINA